MILYRNKTVIYTTYSKTAGESKQYFTVCHTQMVKRVNKNCDLNVEKD